jgi:predicted XRE-type DNA-binding protein
MRAPNRVILRDTGSWLRTLAAAWRAGRPSLGGNSPVATVRTAKKLLLGKEIEHMITAAGKTQEEAAELIETSQSRINGLIDGKGNIAVGDLERLANKLGFTDTGYQAALLELRRDSHKRGFWSTGYRRAYREEIRLRIDLEKHADQIRAVDVEVVPGLVQCESYVRAVYADAPDEKDVSLDDRVQARMSRQDIFDKANPPNVHFVLSESCLRRVWGDTDVMREQLNYLVKLSDRANVMTQVMPFNAAPGRRSSIGDRFTLVRVPSPGVAGPLELAYLETVGEIRYLDDKDALTAHELAWARLSSAALSFEDSRNFIRQVARSY